MGSDHNPGCNRLEFLEFNRFGICLRPSFLPSFPALRNFTSAVKIITTNSKKKNDSEHVDVVLWVAWALRLRRQQLQPPFSWTRKPISPSSLLSHLPLQCPSLLAQEFIVPTRRGGKSHHFYGNFGTRKLANKREEEEEEGMSKLNTSSSELDLDRPNLEDYLPSGSIQEPRGKLRLYFTQILSQFT